MKNLKEYLLKEGIFDPVKEKLDSEIWNDKDLLKNSIKTFILKRFNSWLSTYTNKKVEEAYLIGSSAGFQYSKNSDIDVNLVIDLAKDKIKEIGDFLPNGAKFPGTDHPVNYYISNLKTKKEKMNEWKKDPMYDILNNEWVTKPKRQETKNIIKNFKAVTEIARFFISGIEAAISEYKMDVNSYKTYKNYLKDDVTESEEEEIKEIVKFKLQEIIADIDGIYIAKHMLHSLRIEPYEENFKNIEIYTKISIKSANSTINNLIYKYIEKLGYFDKINEVMDESENWKKEYEKQ